MLSPPESNAKFGAFLLIPESNEPSEIDGPRKSNGPTKNTVKTTPEQQQLCIHGSSVVHGS